MSSGTVTLVFVGGESDLDNLIKNVTSGSFSHVAGFLFDSIYESTGIKENDDPYAGVWLHSPDKYEGNPYAVKVTVEIPDMEGLKAEARRLLGRRYAYLGCIEGALKDLLDIEIAVASEFAVNCSETWTRLLRAGKTEILPGEAPDCVTPVSLYRAIMERQSCA